MVEATSKRLAFLQKITAEGNQDPMALYGLAMEYRALDRDAEALTAFQMLKDKHPGYVAMYLMCGQLLEKMNHKDDARAWYQDGIKQAREARNAHAEGELASALAALD